jgi:hypothetical protein
VKKNLRKYTIKALLSYSNAQEIQDTYEYEYIRKGIEWKIRKKFKEKYRFSKREVSPFPLAAP